MLSIGTNKPEQMSQANVFWATKCIWLQSLKMVFSIDKQDIWLISAKTGLIFGGHFIILIINVSLILCFFPIQGQSGPHIYYIIPIESVTCLLQCLWDRTFVDWIPRNYPYIAWVDEVIGIKCLAQGITSWT